MAYGDMTRTTVLEAVNIMISILGIRPVNDIDTSGVSEAAMARDLLHEVSKEVQTPGWSFNSDIEYPLTPNESDNIEIPANALTCDPCSWYSKYTERANKLYDKVARSFTITETVLCDIVWFQVFTDLPEAARKYIAIRAGRKFQERFQADEGMWKYTADDELQARIVLKGAELRQQDHSIFDNTYLNRAVLRR